MMISIVLDIKNRRKTLMRRLMQPRPRPAHRVLVSCGELKTHSIPKCCAQGESHLNIYNSSDNNLKHKHI